MLKIVSVIVDEGHRREMKINYIVSHQNEKTILEQNMTLRADGCGKFNCELNISDCEGDSYEEILNKMSDWLGRLSLGIKERKETTIPGDVWFLQDKNT